MGDDDVTYADLECEVINTTDEALLLDYGGGKQLWTPRACIGNMVEKDNEAGLFDVEVAEWWANQNGLI